MADHAPDDPTATDHSPEDEAWALAADGLASEAYPRLAELARARPASPAAPLRLYWLLAVKPALDPARTRHDWLADALTRARLSGPAADLYHRELEADPEGALHEPYARLLEADARGGDLLALARRRLAAAGTARSWAAADIDLRAAAARADTFDEADWVAYLVAVAEYAEFDQPSPLHERCSGLLARLGHLEPRYPAAFDRLEEVRRLGHVWRQSGWLPGPVREVVRDAWVGTPGAWQKSLVHAAAWAAENLGVTLAQFDIGMEQAGAGPVVSAFVRLLDQAAPVPPRPYPSNLVRGLVRDFVAELAGGPYIDYPVLRADLLRFMVAEDIDPEELVLVTRVDLSHGTRELAACVRNDPALRLTWRTARAARG